MGPQGVQLPPKQHLWLTTPSSELSLPCRVLNRYPKLSITGPVGQVALMGLVKIPQDFSAEEAGVPAVPRVQARQQHMLTRA